LNLSYPATRDSGSDPAVAVEDVGKKTRTGTGTGTTSIWGADGGDVWKTQAKQYVSYPPATLFDAPSIDTKADTNPLRPFIGSHLLRTPAAGGDPAKVK
jgi:hypothetical protein